MIQKLFKCCGISIARDGSEDDLVFDYDSLQKKKSKKTELIHIDDEENQSNEEDDDSHDSDTDDINEYEKQEIDYDNEYDS